VMFDLTQTHDHSGLSVDISFYSFFMRVVNFSSEKFTFIIVSVECGNMEKDGAKRAGGEPVLRGTTNNTLRLIECCGCVAFPTFSSSVSCKTLHPQDPFSSLGLHSKK